ncbi:MAG TPA: hypothetical protein VFL82_06870, partial [Thermomicrobiales bacterium]|nr:hypothetical protein [Thermomicrobiales bacterium]
PVSQNDGDVAAALLQHRNCRPEEVQELPGQLLGGAGERQEFFVEAGLDDVLDSLGVSRFIRMSEFGSDHQAGSTLLVASSHQR